MSKKKQPDRKQAAERLRQLVNSNFENEIEVNISIEKRKGNNDEKK